MKKILNTIAMLVAGTFVHAQQFAVIKITGTKFPFTIMQQWIDAYSKTHPDIKFELSKAIALDSADILIAAHAFKPGEIKPDQTIIALNRYAQLPIVNAYRPDLKTLQQKGLTQQDLQKIFFSAQNKSDQQSNAFNAYKRDKNVCATRSFSENITGLQQDIYGTTVTGDDRALSAAVVNDINGISYNNLGLVYNIQTRKVADGIAIVPIDINENGIVDEDENHYTTIDDLLDFIAQSGTSKIPQENVNVVLNKNKINKDILDFLQWIITDGQQYNRQYGFMSLGNNVVLQELHLLTAYGNAKN